MSKKFYVLFIAVLALALIGGIYYATADAAKKAAAPAPAKAKDVNANVCYGCHALVKDFHAKSLHKSVNCATCHNDLDAHLKDSKTRPTANTDPDVCAKCHQHQFETFMTHNYEKKAQFDKGDPKSRSPYWETLIRPYAFEISHNETRSHKYMLPDHLINDRAFGGRFKAKLKFQYTVAYVSNKIAPKAWDVLYDAYPDVDPKGPKKAFQERTAPAAVPVCLKCKTSDDHLAWPYMGDPSPATTDLSRAVNPAYNALKYLRNSLPCIHCHDPHSGKHRIVRDALIDALERPEKDTLWHEGYPNKANYTIFDNSKGLGLRGHERKIAILDKADPFLQCGQCHVEYNCGVHFDYEKTEYGKPNVQLDFKTDRRTNHFPFKPLAKVVNNQIVDETFWKHLDKYKYYDLAHYITGAKLWKAQHPEVEVIYNSTHGKAGATCTSCHTAGKSKDKKTGKTVSAHFHASPRAFEWKPCLTCHPTWTSKDAGYAVDSAKNYIKQNMRKAEVWLRELVQRFQTAKDFGVDAKTLNEVRRIHEQSHMYWEWWTAENSDGFHNIENAKATLARSVVLSWKGLAILNKAIAEKNAAK